MIHPIHPLAVVLTIIFAGILLATFVGGVLAMFDKDKEDHEDKE